MNENWEYWKSTRNYTLWLHLFEANLIPTSAAGKTDNFEYYVVVYHKMYTPTFLSVYFSLYVFCAYICYYHRLFVNMYFPLCKETDKAQSRNHSHRNHFVPFGIRLHKFILKKLMKHGTHAPLFPLFFVSKCIIFF